MYTMKITFEEARRTLCEMAKYVEYANVSFGEDNFKIEDGCVVCIGKLYGRTGKTIYTTISTSRPKMVTNIEDFLKKFIEFSEETRCRVNQMRLNTPDPEWYWVINARSFCGKAMVRYCSRVGFRINPDKDKEKLMAFGFKLDKTSNTMQL